MRFAFVGLVLVACASSRPPPVTTAIAPAPHDVSIAKTPVIRFSKADLYVFPTRVNGLSPHAAISYAEIACRSESGKTKCRTRARDETRADDEAEFDGRLDECFHVSRVDVAASALRAIEAAPKTRPATGATLTLLAVDERVRGPVTVPVIDCPGPPCPATRTTIVDMDNRALSSWVAPSNAAFGGAFMMTLAPVALASIDGDSRFAFPNDPERALVWMESIDQRKESDEMQLASLVDLAVLAFRAREETKGVAYAKTLETWLAAHPSMPRTAELEAARATFASLSNGALRTTDPCTNQGAPSLPVTQAPPLAK